MELSREQLAQYAKKPAFQRLIEMLVEAGLLAGQWTADDLLEALRVVHERLEIVAIFGESALGVAETVEVVLQRRGGRRRASKSASQAEWRAVPENRDRERAKDEKRHRRTTRRRKQMRKKAHLSRLSKQRKAASASRKSRVQTLRSTRPRAVVPAWVEVCTRAIA